MPAVLFGLLRFTLHEIRFTLVPHLFYPASCISFFGPSFFPLVIGYWTLKIGAFAPAPCILEGEW